MPREHSEESSPYPGLLRLSWQLAQGLGSCKVGIRTFLHFSSTSGGRPETQKQLDQDNIILATGTINREVGGKVVSVGRDLSSFSGCSAEQSSQPGAGHCPSSMSAAASRRPLEQERGLLSLDMGIRNDLTTLDGSISSLSTLTCKVSFPET